MNAPWGKRVPGQGRVWAPKAPCILQEACAEYGLPGQHLRGSVWSSTQSPAGWRGTHCSSVAVTGTAGRPRTGSPRLHSPPVLWRRPAQVQGAVEGGSLPASYTSEPREAAASSSLTWTGAPPHLGSRPGAV